MRGLLNHFNLSVTEFLFLLSACLLAYVLARFVAARWQVALAFALVPAISFYLLEQGAISRLLYSFSL